MKRTSPKMYSLGFTILELVCSLSLTAILAAFAINSYHQYIERARLEKIKGLLHQNVHYLERWYGQHGTYKDGSSWPKLPYSHTEDYAIQFSALATSVSGNSYILIAMPVTNSIKNGAKYLKTDQEGNIMVCSKPNGKTETCVLS